MPSTVHIDANRHWGGGQQQSLGLARALAAQGEEVSLIAQAGGALAATPISPLIPCETMPLRGLQGILSLPRLLRRVRTLQPDLVHIHDSASQAVASLAARLAGRIAVVVTRRTQLPVRGGWLGRLKHQWCDRVICVSEAVRRQCIAGGLPEERLTVIPDFVDCSYLEPASTAPEEQEGRPTIAIIARLSREKGHRVLLRALPRVIAQIPNLRLVICGQGPEEHNLRRQAQALGISKQVVFRGFVADPRPIVGAAQVVAVPSLSEGLGVAALEAMAMEKPVVASDAGGLPEAVVDGVTGIIVPAGKPEPLAEALVALLTDRARADALGQAGRRHVLQHFDRPHIVARILALYEEVLAERRR